MQNIYSYDSKQTADTDVVKSERLSSWVLGFQAEFGEGSVIQFTMHNQKFAPWFSPSLCKESHLFTVLV